MASSPWFWALGLVLLVAAAASSGSYARLSLRARRWGVRRGLVSLPPGRDLRPEPALGRADISWLSYPAAAWVIASPWTWSYDGVAGAIATDVVTGSCVALIALGAIFFPALWALEALAGLWLVTAPWVVGYGDANGPVGLSDSATGVLVAATALSGLVSASRSLRSGMSGGIGRARSRGDG
jgi:SPW repeat-containing protein